jgi:hypothetical protein
MVTKNVMHLLAIVSVVGGLLRVFAMFPPEYAADIMTKNIVMSQYVLWAILFEIAALNLKE